MNNNIKGRKVKAKKVKKVNLNKQDVQDGEIGSDIRTSLTIPCEHHKGYYSYNNHPLCGTIAATIENYIDNNIALPDDIYMTFLEYVTKKNTTNYYYNYGNTNCISNNQHLLVPVITKIFNFYNPLPNDLTELLSFPVYDAAVCSLVKNNPQFKSFPFSVMVSILDVRFKFSQGPQLEINSTENELIDILFNNSVLGFKKEDSDKLELNFELLMGMRHSYFNKRVSELLDKHDPEDTQDINYTKLMHASCKVLPYSLPIIKSLIGKKVPIDSDCLTIVCQYCNEESIRTILDLGRVKVEKCHFRAVITSKMYIGQTRSGYYYRNNNISTSDDGYNMAASSGFTTQKLEELLKNGYIPDNDDITFSIKYKAEIPNIERYNIKLDQKMLELCWEYDFYPKKYKFDCIQEEMIELQQLCNTKAKVQISKCIKANKLVPDRKCMENASKFKNNQPILNVLMDNGGKVTFKCVENCAHQMNDNRTLILLCDKFKEEYEKQIKEYEEKIKMLENKLNETEVFDSTQSVACVSRGDQLNRETVACEITNNNIPLIDSEVNSNNSESETGQEQEGDIVKILILQDNTTNIPKQLRRKTKLPPIFTEYFNEDKKRLMSYLEVKKAIIDKIRNEHWYDKNNKQLIDLPADLRTKLGLESTGLINFNDVDKLVQLFYN